MTRVSWSLLPLCHNRGLLCHLPCSLASFLEWLGLGCGLCPGSRMSLWGKLAGPGDILTLTPLALLLDRRPCLRDTGAPRSPPQPRRLVSAASIGSAPGRGLSQSTVRWFCSSRLFLSCFSPQFYFTLMEHLLCVHFIRYWNPCPWLCHDQGLL